MPHADATALGMGNPRAPQGTPGTNLVSLVAAPDAATPSVDIAHAGFNLVRAPRWRQASTPRAASSSPTWLGHPRAPRFRAPRFG